MSIKYRIDKANRVVYVEASGEITIEDLIENEKSIVNDPNLEKGYDTYADFSKARPSHTVNIDKIEHSKEFVESIQEHRGQCKWAIYAPDDYTYAYSLMFATLSKELHIDTQVFREEREAYEWLKIEKGT